MSLQEMPDARIGVPLNEIVVKAESMEYPDLDGHGITHDVYEFVERMLSDAHYPRSGIPRDAVRYAAVHYFLQVFDGDDLATFIESTGWDPADREDIREGLKQLGLDEMGAIFADFEAYVENTDDDWYGGEEWYKDPGLMALEARLNQLLPFEDIYDEMGERIKAFPNLRPVPAAQYQNTLTELSERNRNAPVA